MEAQQIQQVHEAASAQVAQIGQQLAAQGLSWANLQAGDLTNLLKAQQTQDQEFQTALTSFSAALVGGAATAARAS